jgi:alkanesulfonate monooxygenase SsuD/methylene tetrahydromethanopterin reductase-like flavin-dependent oxidoreductase (luciferase family)
VADGVLLNWATPERVRRAAALVAESAARTGRDPASVTIAVYVRGCLGAEDSLAIEALRVATGQYAAMPHYRRQMESSGLGDQARRAAEAVGRGRPDEVPEELVRALCVFGDANAAKSRLDEFREAGAAVPVVYPVPVLDAPSSIMSTMLAVAPSPALQP